MPYRTFDAVFERFRYPAGESHLRLRPEIDLAALDVIEAAAWGFDDLGQILTADRILRHNGVVATWFLPYFPFARHDRRNDARDGLELRLALEWVEPLQLVIADPHSDVAGLLPHIPQRDVVERFDAAGAFDGDPIVVVPDAGAAKKVESWAGARPRVQALKRRDPNTGRLSGFQILADDLQGRPVLIVDDLCDAGGTFLGLAQALAHKNAGPARLAITHGLFTKGTRALGEAFERIYTFAAPGTAHVPGPKPDADGVVRLPFATLFQKGTTR